MESEQGWGDGGIPVVVLLDSRSHDILGGLTVGAYLVAGCKVFENTFFYI